MDKLISQFSTLRLYKECLRIAKHAAKTTRADEKALMMHVKQSFRANMHETDPVKIEAMREVAVRAILNYMTEQAKEVVAKNHPIPSDTTFK